jgi:hypothetical protein
MITVDNDSAVIINTASDTFAGNGGKEMFPSLTDLNLNGAAFAVKNMAVEDSNSVINTAHTTFRNNNFPELENLHLPLDNPPECD